MQERPKAKSPASAASRRRPIHCGCCPRQHRRRAKAKSRNRSLIARGTRSSAESRTNFQPGRLLDLGGSLAHPEPACRQARSTIGPVRAHGTACERGDHAWRRGSSRRLTSSRKDPPLISRTSSRACLSALGLRIVTSGAVDSFGMIARVDEESQLPVG